jgi:inorganic triphosphatase YgiF
MTAKLKRAEPAVRVLPPAIRLLPLADKLQRLANLDPEKARKMERGFELLVEDNPRRGVWRENFYAGPRGGAMLKSCKAGLESDKRRARAISEKGGPR